MAGNWERYGTGVGAALMMFVGLEGGGTSSTDIIRNLVVRISDKKGKSSYLGEKATKKGVDIDASLDLPCGCN